MIKPVISIIAAIDKNRGIGKNNKLVWNIPEDLQHFRFVTNGHPVIMGRKTFESIGRPLPNRTNIIVTRNKLYAKKGIVVKHSLEEAVSYAKKLDESEIFIIGGAEIYHQGIEIANRLYITVIQHQFDVDSYFPEYSLFTRVISSRKSSDKNYQYTFYILER